MKKSAIFIRSVLILLLPALMIQCQGGGRKTDTQKVEKLSLDTCPAFPLEGWEHFYKPAFEGFMHAYQPCVVEVPDTEFPYRMWFFGWVTDIANPGLAGADAIYFARGRDLDTWEVYCKDGSWDETGDNERWASVLYSSDDPKDYYQTFHTGDPSVVLKDGVYYMAYSATSQAFVDPDSPELVLPPTFSNMDIEGYPARMIQCVMGATSTDGINWTKTEKPLLLGEADTKFPPDPAPHRIGDFHRPCLLWDDEGERWMLYFDYRNMALGLGSIVGLAENKGDFMTGDFEFVHSLDEPLLTGWPNPEMVRVGPCYVSFSDAPGYTRATAPEGREVSAWQLRQLRMATSDDGLTWEKQYYFDPDPGMDADHVPQALVTRRDGKWWLYCFYTTQVGWRWEEGKYPFFKKGDYNWFYDQVRYMRQEIRAGKN